VSKKHTKKSANPRGWKASYAQVERWMIETEAALRAQNFKLVKALAQKVLRHVPSASAPGKDALNYLGTALAMLQEYEASYQVLSEALALQPENAELWYNRSLSARFTVRFGQSLRDLEQAIALEDDEKLLAMYTEQLGFMRKITAEDMALRGPDFTLDQLIEQQHLFNQAIALFEKRQYTEAERVLKQVIEMADVLPQPWANLAGCYMWQQRYDEAEAALKRALEIDPTYELAQENLQMMPIIRQRGVSALTTTIKPAFAGEQIRQDLIILE